MKNFEEKGLGKVSDSIKQYANIKKQKQYLDAVVLFRCGDSYETYCDDAITVSKILGITFTYSFSERVEIARFDHLLLSTYLPELIRAGKRVAVGELEDNN